MAAQAEQYHHPLPAPPPAPAHQQQHSQYSQYSQNAQYSQNSQNAQQAPAGFQYYQQNSQQYERPAPHNRTVSAQSAKSHKSHKSQTSVGSKKDLTHETHEEKEARRLHGKADPTFAMNEAEPAAIAAQHHESSVQPLRSLQHKDFHGNLIADPDRSNPTRNRWERPLDTIRSFEAAIDGGYSRQSIYRSETDSAANWNRRTSMASTVMQPRFPQDNYYSNSSRPVSFRAEGSHYGFSGPSTARNSGFFDGQGIGNYGNGYGPAPARQIPRQRMHLEQQYQTYGREREQGVYPLPHKDRSYETVTSAAGSGNSDPAGYQTDPTSSDNSSIRRASPAKRQEPINDYGIGFSQGQSQAYQQDFSFRQAPQQTSHPLPPPPANTYQDPRPQVPRKGVLRRQSSRAQQEQPDTSDKRKSWFSRRFSKAN